MPRRGPRDPPARGLAGRVADGAQQEAVHSAGGGAGMLTMKPSTVDPDVTVRFRPSDKRVRVYWPGVVGLRLQLIVAGLEFGVASVTVR